MSYHKYLKKEEPKVAPLLSQQEAMSRHEADWRARAFDSFEIFGIPSIQMRNTGRIQSDQLDQPKDHRMYFVDRDPHTGLETKTLLETTPLPDYRDDKDGDDEKEHLSTGVYEDEFGNCTTSREMYDDGIAELSVGSTLKFEDLFGSAFFTIGKHYKICEISGTGDVYVTDDKGDISCIDPSEFNWVSHG